MVFKYETANTGTTITTTKLQPCIRDQTKKIEAQRYHSTIL